MERLVACFVLAALVVATVAPAQGASAKRALVTWDVAGERFRTYLNAPADIARVRAAIRAGESAGIPTGRIYRGERENRGHRWHLRDVHLAEVTIELCDGRPSDLDGNLRYWRETVKRYCPWGAVPRRLRWVAG